MLWCRSHVQFLVILGLLVLASCTERSRPAEPIASVGEWRDANQQAHRPLDPSAHPATVFLFLATECPISNGYAPELGRLVETYGPRNVAFYGVHADPAVTATDAKRHAEEFGLPFPILLDPTHALTQRLGATITPEAAVVDQTGTVRYLGRIDDLYYGFGKRRHAATTHELRDAIDAVLEGKTVARTSVLPIGCEIAPVR